MAPAITIICVHGVGLWPGLFEGIDFGAPSIAMTRPGYDSTSPVDVAGNVEAVAALAEQTDGAVLVGVSGGATIALAGALEAIEGVVAAVSHEPLIGALEPELDDRVRAWADDLDATPGVESSQRFLEGLYGRASWRKMPPEARDWADDHADVICREVSHFAAFQPAAGQLADLPIPHLSTVGAHSTRARHRVAALLAQGGSRVAVIEDAGHHVLIDRPDRFADAVRSFLKEAL